MKGGTMEEDDEITEITSKTEIEACFTDDLTLLEALRA